MIDFGISKAISGEDRDNALTFTAHGQFIGTPQYMSPEQAAAKLNKIDERSDVYSLGVLLYELLTGTTPIESHQIEGLGISEIQQLICNSELTKPSTRIRMRQENEASVSWATNVDSRKPDSLIRGDLDWIAMKALEKEPDRRYENVSAFANDVEAYLSNEKVTATPHSVVYRLRKFLQRKDVYRFAERFIAIAAILIAVAVIARGVWFRGEAPPHPNETPGIGMHYPPPNDASLSKQHPSLEQCKLVLLAETGAAISIEDARDFIDSRSQGLLPPGLITMHANRREEVVRTIKQDGDWLVWEMPLSLDWSHERNSVDGRLGKRNSGLGPQDISLKLRFAISRNGTFQLGTLGTESKEHFASARAAARDEQLPPLWWRFPQT